MSKLIKVLNISSYDLNSSKFNGYDWVGGLAQYGISSELLVLNKQSDSKNVETMSHANVILRIFVKVLNLINKRFNIRKEYVFGSRNVFRKNSYKNADVIHLHIVLDGTLDIETLKRITKEKKVVWTWHDPSPTTGHCVTPMDCSEWITNCSNCPDLKRPIPIRNIRGLQSTEMKFDVASNASVVHVSTNWMLSLISNHPNFSKIKLSKLSFGLDTNTFYPTQNQGFRKRLGIKDSEFVIGFRQTTDTYKNMKFIMKYLESVESQQNLTIFTIGQTGLLEKYKTNPTFSIIEIPWTNVDEELRNYYNSLDVFISPSRFESFGFMPLEAMACGTRVIGVTGSSVDEICELEKYGWRVQDGDIESLVNLINQISTEEFDETKRLEMVKFVQEKFDLNLFLKELARLYKEVYLEK